MSDTLKPISDATFEEIVLKADKPVLVDFWAPWCGPCKALSPTLEAVAAEEEYSDRIQVVTLNIDDNEETTAKYGVRSIPTLMIFENGENIGTKSGGMPKAALKEFIDRTLDND